MSLSIVHGRILLEEQGAARSMECLGEWPKPFQYLRPEMFSLGSLERPHFYDHPVIGFAGTYKHLYSAVGAFVIEFEALLRQLSFTSAKIQFELEFFGTYHFTWIAKTPTSRFGPEQKLIETAAWFFGVGPRGLYGTLTRELEPADVFDVDFQYPIEFDPAVIEALNKCLLTFDPDTRFYLNAEMDRKILSGDALHTVLTCLRVSGDIDFGFEHEKGLWLMKLRPNIDPITKTHHI